MRGVHRRCVGGYAAVSLIIGYGIVAFRDPYGIRPVCYGVRETEHGLQYMISSESVALNALGFELVRDLEPGEAVSYKPTDKSIPVNARAIRNTPHAFSSTSIWHGRIP